MIEIEVSTKPANHMNLKRGCHACCLTACCGSEGLTSHVWPRQRGPGARGVGGQCISALAPRKSLGILRIGFLVAAHPTFHGDNRGSNPLGDASEMSELGRIGDAASLQNPKISPKTRPPARTRQDGVRASLSAGGRKARARAVAKQRIAPKRVIRLSSVPPNEGSVKHVARARPHDAGDSCDFVTYEFSLFLSG